MALYLERDGRLIAMAEQAYATEDDLQRLIAQHPELLTGEDSADQLILIQREISVADREEGGGRWSLDHLYVDQDGVPTLVEVKRSSDTRSRREVVGQMLDYAANGSRYWPIDELQNLFAARCAKRDKAPDDVLRSAFGADLDVQAWWAAVEANLRDGVLRLVFVADRIKSELRSIIEFLNEQMTETTVLGIEVRQFVSAEATHRTIAPQVVGESERAKVVKGGRWNFERWFEVQQRRRDSQDVEVAKRLLEWARSNGVGASLGSGKHDAAMKLERTVDGQRVPVVHLFTVGRVELQLGQMRRAPAFADRDARRRFADRLNQIDGVTIEDDRLDLYPAFSIRLLRAEAALERFIDALGWAFAGIARGHLPPD